MYLHGGMCSVSVCAPWVRWACIGHFVRFLKNKKHPHMHTCNRLLWSYNKDRGQTHVAHTHTHIVHTCHTHTHAHTLCTHTTHTHAHTHYAHILHTHAHKEKIIYIYNSNNSSLSIINHNDNNTLFTTWLYTSGPKSMGVIVQVKFKLQQTDGGDGGVFGIWYRVPSGRCGRRP